MPTNRPDRLWPPPLPSAAFTQSGTTTTATTSMVGAFTYNVGLQTRTPSTAINFRVSAKLLADMAAVGNELKMGLSDTARYLIAQGVEGHERDKAAKKSQQGRVTQETLVIGRRPTKRVPAKEPVTRKSTTRKKPT